MILSTGEEPSANLVIGLEFVSFLYPAHKVIFSYKHEIDRTDVAFRPMGLTLIMPLRNSINVPLY